MRTLLTLAGGAGEGRLAARADHLVRAHKGRRRLRDQLQLIPIRVPWIVHLALEVLAKSSLWRDRGRRVELERPSAVFRRALEDLGVARFLGCIPENRPQVPVPIVEVIKVVLGPVVVFVLIFDLGVLQLFLHARRSRCRVTPLRPIRSRLAMVLPEGFRIDVGANGLQPAVDDAVVVVAGVICGPADGILTRENIADVALTAVGVRDTASSIVLLLADLVTKRI